jgi:ABC-2 type transport system ATP-binding protein
MREKVAAGHTVFFSTHLLDQAERLCSRMAIIHRGRLAAAGSLGELRANLPENSSLEEVFFAHTGDSGEPGP